jgi:hypothetical protein
MDILCTPCNQTLNSWAGIQALVLDAFDFGTYDLYRGNPEKGREAAAPSNIKEIQEIQGGQEAPHNGDTISPKDA